jgi:GNAT superfamily N-acetyltransferase
LSGGMNLKYRIENKCIILYYDGVRKDFCTSFLFINRRNRLMSLEVRTILYEELHKLLSLYKHLHSDDPDVKEYETLNQLWDEIYNDPNLHYIVADNDGELVASCTIAIVKNLTRGLRPYGLIENAVTHKDFRKMGYGTEVLHKAVEIAKECNCYKVMLMTGSKSEDTLRFYEKAGFVKGIKTGFIVNL